MRVGLTLKPGKRGTKSLLAKYGDRLVCVRYRYDAKRRRRLKTVELIVEERDWDPPAGRRPPDELVGVRVEWGERELARRLKHLGARWNARRKVWELAHGKVVALGLEERIVAECIQHKMRCAKAGIQHKMPGEDTTGVCFDPSPDASIQM